jgi:hypothetical protein
MLHGSTDLLLAVVAVFVATMTTGSYLASTLLKRRNQH